MTRFIRSLWFAAMTVTLGAGAANAAPRDEAPRSEPRSHVEHGRGDRDWRDDHDHVRAVRIWRGERWVTVYEPVVVDVPVVVEPPPPMTAWDFAQRAAAERSAANRLRGDARFERMFWLVVPADNAEREARFLDQRAAADDAEAHALSAPPPPSTYER